MGVGDALVAAGDARRLRESAGCGPVVIKDKKGRASWHPLWAHCPDVGKVGTHSVTNGKGCRPYSDYSGLTAERWVWKEYQPYPARVVIPQEILDWAKPYSGCVVIEPTIKDRASPNKQWHGWQRLVSVAHAIPWLQIGTAPTLEAVPFVETPTFLHALAVLSVSRSAVLPEGGLHHGAAAVGLPSVVIYGGFISPAQTGYALHTNIFTGGEPCGKRVPCSHCHDAMARITPEIMADHLYQLLEKRE